MDDFEIEIKNTLNEYKITISKDENYNQWNYEASLLGKKIGALRKSQRREIIAQFLDIIIRWNNLILDNKGYILLIETFIGKQYDVRLILNILLQKKQIKGTEELTQFKAELLKQKYYPILEKRIINFEKMFIRFTEKYNTTERI